MKTLITIALFISFNSFAVDGLTIGNAHQVDKTGNVFRGKEPKALVDELAHIGITDVIIYKNEVKDEVTKEISELKRLGITSHHIPFRWKQYPSMVEACEQTVEALNIIHKVKTVMVKCSSTVPPVKTELACLQVFIKCLKRKLQKIKSSKVRCVHVVTQTVILTSQAW